MVRLSCLILVLLLQGVCCAEAQEEDDMATSYVKLVVLGDDEAEGEATGIAITENLCLTAFHVLEENTRVVAVTGRVNDEGEPVGTFGEPIECDPYRDWCIIDFEKPIFKPKKFALAKSVKVGQIVFSISNLLGLGPIYIETRVAALRDGRVYIYPPLGRGSSGAALFTRDDKGRLTFAGMFQGERMMESSPTSIGFALHVDYLREVIEKYRRPPPRLVEFPVSPEVGGKEP